MRVSGEISGIAEQHHVYCLFMKPEAALRRFTMMADGRRWSFMAPADPLQLLNSLTDNQWLLDKYQPYWAEHWPSAQALFAFFGSMRIPCRARICEIGCGIGVCASLLRARSQRAIALDISWNACVFAGCNMRENGLTSGAVCGDWRHPPFRTSFDIIAGADILYETRFITAVADCIEAMLCSNGAAYIADPRRQNWPAFQKELRSRGFRLRIVHEETVNDGMAVVEVLEARKSQMPIFQ